jgi:hypothetical protein
LGPANTGNMSSGKRACDADVRVSEAHVQACAEHVRMCETSERRSLRPTLR